MGERGIAERGEQTREEGERMGNKKRISSLGFLLVFFLLFFFAFTLELRSVNLCTHMVKMWHTHTWQWRGYSQCTQ